MCSCVGSGKEPSIKKIHPSFEILRVDWRNSTPQYVLSERGTESNSFLRVGIELTTVALIVRPCAAVSWAPQEYPSKYKTTEHLFTFFITPYQPQTINRITVKHY